MEVFPRIVLCVDMVLVDVIMQVDIGEYVLQLWVVMIRNWGEWIEKIGVYFFELRDCCPLSFLGLDLLFIKERLDNKQIHCENTWVKEEMGTIAHSAKSA